MLLATGYTLQLRLGLQGILLENQKWYVLTGFEENNVSAELFCLLPENEKVLGFYLHLR